MSLFAEPLALGLDPTAAQCLMNLEMGTGSVHTLEPRAGGAGQRGVISNVTSEERAGQTALFSSWA